MKKNTHLLSYLLVFAIVLSGCRKTSFNDITTDSTGGKDIFISATSSGSYTKAELAAFATANGFAGYIPVIQYDVDFYKIIYYTTCNGDKVQVSGLLAIPKNMSTTPALLSAQHGTIFSYADAPSNFPNSFTGFELFASAGFITIIPDYIGFGVSKNSVHPYYDMHTSGLTVSDMLKATKYYLKTQNKPVSDKLFLVGYSEGGYVTMAAQKEIETSTDNYLSLTAAAEGAGGYDITGMLTQVATMPSYPDPSFFASFILSYNTTYGFNRPLTDYFAQPYAGEITQLLDGSKNSAQINGQLTTSLSLLFNPTFYSNLSNPTGELAFKAKVAENSFPNWYPKSPTRLYHGTADEDVFFTTSLSTYNKFIAGGATKLTLIPIPGGTHETSVGPMMLDALSWFKSLQ